MLKEKLLKNKKRLAIVSSLALCLCVGTLIGGKMLVNNVKADEDLAKTKTETVSIVDKDTGQKEVADTDSKEVNEAVKQTENKSSDNNSSGSSNSNKNDSNKNNGGNKDSTKPSTPSKPSEPSKPSKPSEPSKPAHTHSWVAIKEAVYEDVPVYGPKCYGCGASLGGGATAHVTADPFDNCSSWGTGIIGYDSVYAGDKIVGYKCSCGATK